jgi:hypothetical protein
VEGAADMGEDLLEASEDIGEAIDEHLPGDGAVAQALDVASTRLRVATTAFKGPAKDASG